MSKILRDYLGLQAAQEYKVKDDKQRKLKDHGIDPSLLLGVELEIENLDREEEDRSRRIVAGMQYHKDGSLRNNGGEFVTLPMTYQTLEYVLGMFFAKNKLDENNYSERCSVHVHANCQDLTLEQIRLILCLYQIVEKVLFCYIKQDRDKNIFCVPLGESIIASQIMLNDATFIQHTQRRWRKYTALNLLPLYTQGTIEFRHMAGTCDEKYILEWCNIISCLFKYARNHKFDDVVKSLMDLNTSSAYATFMQDIFPGNIYEALAVGPYREFLEEGVINMKVMLANPKAVQKTPEIIEDDLNAGFRFVQENNQTPRPPRDPRLPQAMYASAIRQQEVDRHNLNRILDGQLVMTYGDTERWIGRRADFRENPVDVALNRIVLQNNAALAAQAAQGINPFIAAQNIPRRRS